MDTALFLTLFLFAVQTAAGVAPMRWPQHNWLAGWIFYLSGFFAVICLGVYLVSNRDWIVPNIQPPHIIGLGLAISIVGLVWHWRQSHLPNTALAETASVDLAPQISRLRNERSAIAAELETTKKSLATKSDELSKLQNLQAAAPLLLAQVRINQLRSKVEEARSAANCLRESGRILSNYMLPWKPTPKNPAPLMDPEVMERQNSHRGASKSWGPCLQRLQEISKLIYGESIDVESIPELKNPRKKAPNEDLFGDDDDKAYKYREFHFLTENIISRAYALVGRMETEIREVEQKTVNSPLPHSQ